MHVFFCIVYTAKQEIFYLRWRRTYLSLHSNGVLSALLSRGNAAAQKKRKEEKKRIICGISEPDCITVENVQYSNTDYGFAKRNNWKATLFFLNI